MQVRQRFAGFDGEQPHALRRIWFGGDAVAIHGKVMNMGGVRVARLGETNF